MIEVFGPVIRVIGEKRKLAVPQPGIEHGNRSVNRGTHVFAHRQLLLKELRILDSHLTWAFNRFSGTPSITVFDTEEKRNSFSWLYLIRYTFFPRSGGPPPPLVLAGAFVGVEV